eukprot:Blabericola_migrator_1__2974@NODE_185_length_11802_cov_66_327567_g160_i0_p1_GENE_NODE_185_length_11802_cov_66_327567_g160_i0NODE_185_length_11802_cov_66_327567_g160_i0_p1_ORF_typecomplete_len1492_score278_44_NODE_185_length_11802_cov_66_327567_g160_i054169891
MSLSSLSLLECAPLEKTPRINHFQMDLLRARASRRRDSGDSSSDAADRHPPARRRVPRTDLDGGTSDDDDNSNNHFRGPPINNTRSATERTLVSEAAMKNEDDLEEGECSEDDSPADPSEPHCPMPAIESEPSTRPLPLPLLPMIGAMHNAVMDGGDVHLAKRRRRTSLSDRASPLLPFNCLPPPPPPPPPEHLRYNRMPAMSLPSPQCASQQPSRSPSPPPPPPTDDIEEGEAVEEEDPMDTHLMDRNPLPCPAPLFGRPPSGLESFLDFSKSSLLGSPPTHRRRLVPAPVRRDSPVKRTPPIAPAPAKPVTPTPEPLSKEVVIPRKRKLPAASEPQVPLKEEEPVVTKPTPATTSATAAFTIPRRPIQSARAKTGKPTRPLSAENGSTDSDDWLLSDGRRSAVSAASTRRSSDIAPKSVRVTRRAAKTKAISESISKAIDQPLKLQAYDGVVREERPTIVKKSKDFTLELAKKEISKLREKQGSVDKQTTDKYSADRQSGEKQADGVTPTEKPESIKVKAKCATKGADNLPDSIERSEPQRKLNGELDSEPAKEVTDAPAVSNRPKAELFEPSVHPSNKSAILKEADPEREETPLIPEPPEVAEPEELASKPEAPKSTEIKVAETILADSRVTKSLDMPVPKLSAKAESKSLVKESKVAGKAASEGQSKSNKAESKSSKTVDCPKPTAIKTMAVKAPEPKAAAAHDSKSVKAPEVKSIKAPDTRSVKPLDTKSVTIPEIKSVKATDNKTVKAPERTVKASEIKSLKSPETKSIKMSETKSSKAPDIKPSKLPTPKPVKAPDPKPTVKPPDTSKPRPQSEKTTRPSEKTIIRIASDVALRQESSEDALKLPKALDDIKGGKDIKAVKAKEKIKVITKPDRPTEIKMMDVVVPTLSQEPSDENLVPISITLPDRPERPRSRTKRTQSSETTIVLKTEDGLAEKPSTIKKRKQPIVLKTCLIEESADESKTPPETPRKASKKKELRKVIIPSVKSSPALSPASPKQSKSVSPAATKVALSDLLSSPDDITAPLSPSGSDVPESVVQAANKALPLLVMPTGTPGETPAWLDEALAAVTPLSTSAISSAAPSNVGSTAGTKPRRKTIVPSLTPVTSVVAPSITSVPSNVTTPNVTIVSTIETPTQGTLTRSESKSLLLIPSGATHRPTAGQQAHQSHKLIPEPSASTNQSSSIVQNKKRPATTSHERIDLVAQRPATTTGYGSSAPIRRMPKVWTSQSPLLLSWKSSSRIASFSPTLGTSTVVANASVPFDFPAIHLNQTQFRFVYSEEEADTFSRVTDGDAFGHEKDGSKQEEAKSQRTEDSLLEKEERLQALRDQQTRDLMTLLAQFDEQEIEEMNEFLVNYSDDRWDEPDDATECKDDSGASADGCVIEECRYFLGPPDPASNVLEALHEGEEDDQDEAAITVASLAAMFDRRDALQEAVNKIRPNRKRMLTPESAADDELLRPVSSSDEVELALILDQPSVKRRRYSLFV